MWLIVLPASIALLVIALSVYGSFSRSILTNHHLDVKSFPLQYSLSDTSLLSSNEYSRRQLVTVGGNGKPKLRILLFIAHPDDETMFFGPTLLGLAKKSPKLDQGIEVYIHCLSKGMNCGNVRRKELEKASPLLGVSVDRVYIDDLEDGDDWLDEEVSTRLEQVVKRWDIDVILTFDSYGVSGHKNHRSCYRGSKLFLGQRMPSTGRVSSQMEGEISSPDSILQSSFNTSSQTQKNTLNPLKPIYGYSLDSSAFLVKYSAWLYFPSFVNALKSHSQFQELSSPLLFSNPSSISVHHAMLAHHSQYVWFRKIYIVLSHYVFFNALSPILP